MIHMGQLRLVGSLKLQVYFAKEPYKRDDILQKRHVILRSLLIVATRYMHIHAYICKLSGKVVQMVCVYIHIYMHTHKHTYEYMHIYMCVYIYIFIYVYTYMLLYMNIRSKCIRNRSYASSYIYMCIYIYIYVYIYIFIYIHTHV